MSCTKKPEVCCGAPDTRWIDSVARCGPPSSSMNTAAAAAVGHQRPHAAVHRRPPRVVDLADLCVDTIFGEVCRAKKGADTIRRCVIELGADVLVVDPGVVIDRSALDGSDDRKPIGREEA